MALAAQTQNAPMKIYFMTFALIDLHLDHFDWIKVRLALIFKAKLIQK